MLKKTEINTDVQMNFMHMKCGVLMISEEFILCGRKDQLSKIKFMIKTMSIKLTQKELLLRMEDGFNNQIDLFRTFI